MKSWFVVLTLLIFAISFAQALEPLDDSLILYLSFDELTGKRTIDHSKYKNHGEIFGSPKLVDGKFGKALEFNGVSDWVEVPHDDSLTVDKNVTVMAWIKTSRYHGPGGAQWQGILAKSNFPYSTRSYSLYTDLKYLCLHLSVGGDGSACNGKLKLREWQHVVAQVDDGTHRYWINGENVGEFGGKPPPPGKIDTMSVRIGRTHESGRGFLGLIDEVRIWNRALSEVEVIAQMRMGSSGIIVGNTAMGSPVQLTFAVPSKVSVGEKFTATLRVSDVRELSGAQFILAFNPAVLEVADVNEGDFLSQDGSRTFFQVTKIDNVGGELSGIRLARFGQGGVSGSGVLLKVVFRAKTAGNSPLTLRDVKLGNVSGGQIPSDVSVATVTVSPVPDVTGDGRVDILDLVLVSRHFGPASAAPAGVDINGDGAVDILDLILLAHRLGN